MFGVRHNSIMARLKIAHPTEHAEQAALFAWAALATRQRPALALLFAVPNAAKRSPSLAAYMKAEGLKAGVPDIVLPQPVGPFGGLYIELKSMTGSPTAEQKQWVTDLNAAGNYAAVCKGWLAAKVLIEDYLDGHLATLHPVQI